MSVHERDRVEARRSSGKKWPWILLALLALIAIAIVAFFALGGDADVDTEGGDVDVEAPDVDADINAPEIDADVDTSDGGDADAEANKDD